MSDYFDQVERGLREAVRRRDHMPWYSRMRPRRTRALAVGVAVLVGGGSALAASGVLRSGTPLGPEVPAIATADEGAVIPASVRLLSLRVPDPSGGPPWGLRIVRTTRGLMCVQPGRIVAGRVGVLGQDGAFANDGAFHPLAGNFLDGIGCGTEDARGDAFVSEEAFGVPASGLFPRQRGRGACYGGTFPSPRCPSALLRDLYFGLLGPDVVNITHRVPGGALAVSATAGGDGAYLVVLPHEEHRCAKRTPDCDSGGRGYMPATQLHSGEVIRAVTYRGAPPCRLPAPSEYDRTMAARNARFVEQLHQRLPAIYRLVLPHGGTTLSGFSRLSRSQIAELEALRAPMTRAGFVSCPAVGYVPLASPYRGLTAADLASRVTVHAEPARHYCERAGGEVIPCNGRRPRGSRRLESPGGPPELLEVVEFTSRVAITNFDAHYEINTTNPSDPGNPRCPPAGGGGFGPTSTNLRAGQMVRHQIFVNPECHGVVHVTVGLVTVNGPSGSMPVPGLPGQAAEIPVGSTQFTVP